MIRLLGRHTDLLLLVMEASSLQNNKMLLLLHRVLILLVVSNSLPTLFPVGAVSALHDDHQASSMEICNPCRCSIDGPEIKFPFSKQEQPGRCGYPGFQVSCSASGNTFINLSSYPQPLNISYISYVDAPRVTYLSNQLAPVNILSISHNCPFDIVFHPNFFSTPFKLFLSYPRSYYYYYSDTNPYYYRWEWEAITKIQCSSRVTGFYQMSEVSCLSKGPGDYVYVASPNFIDWATLPSFCQRSQTIFIPIYSIIFLGADMISYLANSPEVLLTWILPGCEGCSTVSVYRESTCGFANPTSNKTICRHSDATPHHADPVSNYRHDYHQKRTVPAKYVILGVILGVVLIALASTVAYFKIQKHKKSNAEKLQKQKKVDKFLADYKSLKPSRYSYADIKRMTSHWKTKLGEGGYGSVYKGELPNQTPIAVKVLKSSIDDGEDFTNEVGTIGRIHHINVVRLLGFCADGVHHALIFQFMPNGPLDNFIFSKEGREKIGSWESLQDIAISIAQGMEYLHQGCEQRILHFDIKPSNILLDHDLQPKISDFGLAKLCSKDASLVSMSAVRGTIGYIAPEILTRNSRNVSSKSDVYSYGMLLLEMVTGRKNIFEGDHVDRNNGQTDYYPEYLYTCLKNGQPMELGVFMAGDGSIAKKLIVVAMWCIQWFPVNRPSMKMVIRMMYGSTESLEIPPNPFVVNDDAYKENEAHVITLDPVLEEQ